MGWQVSAGGHAFSVKRRGGIDEALCPTKRIPSVSGLSLLSFHLLHPILPSPSILPLPAFMPSASSHPQSLTPYVPGAWPSSSRDQHDDTAQDADVSSVSSYGGSSLISRTRKDGRKARRRWTYTGPVRPYSATIVPPGLTPSNLASLSPTISNDLKLSPVTDATVSDLLVQHLQNLIIICF